MTGTDEHGENRLAEVREWIDTHGLAPVVGDTVRQLWRANCDRHDPAGLGDDTVTLGFLTARNITNQLRKRIRHDADLTAAGVRATQERGAVVVKTAVADLRFVKAPQRSGRHPRFDADFRWTKQEGRLAAATRNAHWLSATGNGVDGSTLFDFMAVNEASGLDACRDVFVIWAGDLDTTLTSAWLGLPTLGPYPFLAVQPLWRDETTSRAVVEPTPQAAGDVTFGAEPAPQPIVTLKPRQHEAGQQ